MLNGASNRKLLYAKGTADLVEGTLKFIIYPIDDLRLIEVSTNRPLFRLSYAMYFPPFLGND